MPARMDLAGSGRVRSHQATPQTTGAELQIHLPHHHLNHLLLHLLIHLPFH